jgi:hypothetical protein
MFRGTVNYAGGGGGGGQTPGFNINPGPQTGNGAYGRVPGQISLPPNIYSQLSGALPNFAGLTSGASDIIGSEQSGTLSQNTMNALKNAAAQFGVSSGMGPGSGLEQNKFFGNIAGWSENRQRQGLQDFNSLVGAISPTLTSPQLAASVAERNATMAAAPDPEAAAKEQLALFDRYYNRSNPGSAGSTWVGMHNPGSVLAPRYAGAGGVVAGSSADPWNWPEPNYTNPPAVGPIGSPAQPETARWGASFGSWEPWKPWVPPTNPVATGDPNDVDLG